MRICVLDYISVGGRFSEERRQDLRELFTIEYPKGLHVPSHEEFRQQLSALRKMGVIITATETEVAIFRDGGSKIDFEGVTKTRIAEFFYEAGAHPDRFF